MKAIKLNHLILLFSLFLLAACDKENPVQETGVRIHFISDLAVHADDRSDNLKITEAVMGIEQINLKLAGIDTTGTGVKAIFNGPYRLNLIDGNLSPNVRLILADPGKYENIELYPGTLLKDRNTFFVKGALRTKGTSWTPFELASAYDLVYAIGNGNKGFTIRSGEIKELTVFIYLKKLFENLDLSSAKIEADGTILINESSNPQILAKLFSRIKNPQIMGFTEGGIVPDLQVPAEDKKDEDPLTGNDDSDGNSEQPGSDDNSGSNDDSGSGNDSGDGTGDNQDDDPVTGNDDSGDNTGSNDDNGSNDDDTGSGGDADNDSGSSGDGTDGSSGGSTGGSSDDDSSDDDSSDDDSSDDDSSGGFTDDDSDSGSSDNEDDSGDTDTDSDSGSDGSTDSGTDSGTGGETDSGNDDGSGNSGSNKGKGNNNGNGNDDNPGNGSDDNEKKKIITISL